MRNWNIAFGFVLAAALGQGCSSRVNGGDSETHWIACDDTDDCPGSQVCMEDRCVDPSGSGGAESSGGSGATSGGAVTAAGGSGSGGASGGGGGGTGGADAPDWSCLGQGGAPFSEDVAPVNFRLQSVVESAPIAGAQVHLCLREDMECLGDLGPPLTTDAEGRIVVEIPLNFNGFARFTSEAHWPTYYYFNRRTRRSTEVVVTAATGALVNQLSSLVNSPQKDGNGVALLNVRDCAGKPAPDVSFGEVIAGVEAVTFYSIGGIPSRTATYTDDSGFGGIVNVGPGNFQLTAVRTATGQPITTNVLYAPPNAVVLTDLAPHGP